MEILIGSQTIRHDSGGWSLSIADEPSGQLWSTIQPLEDFKNADPKRLLSILNKQYDRARRDELTAVRFNNSLLIYPVAASSSYDLSFADLIRHEEPIIIAETVFENSSHDVPVGILLMGVSSSACAVRYIEINDSNVWKREILSVRRGKTRSIFLPAWLHDDLDGVKEFVGGVKINPDDPVLIRDLLNDNVSISKGTVLADWLSREHAKSQAKTMMVYIGFAAGTILYIAGFIFGALSNSVEDESNKLNREKLTLASDLDGLKTDEFLVNWKATPSLITAMRDVTGSLGDYAKIIQMSGSVEPGKRVNIEGLAQAIKGNLKNKAVDGMKMETVVTQGKIGVRFSLVRKMGGVAH